MLMYNSNMDKNMGAFRRGFTIIEVMLFLALTGLLLVGILGGLGGNIARQRYNDAVQDLANILRDQYSFVSDTQISIRTQDSSCYGLVSSDFHSEGPSDYFRSRKLSSAESVSFRGRTNCVVYGAVVFLNEDYIETTELLGRDYQAVDRSMSGGIPQDATDLQILKQYVTANNMSFHCTEDYSECTIRSGDKTRSQVTKWGTKMQNVDGTPLRKTLLIFRSPRDGSIRTYVKDGLVKVNEDIVKYSEIDSANNGAGLSYTNPAALDNYGINRYLTSSNFKVEDLDICLESGDGQTYNNARRLVKVQRGGRGQNAVELINLDSEKDESAGNKVGVQSCQ